LAVLALEGPFSQFPAAFKLQKKPVFQGKEFCSMKESILIILSSTGTSVTSVSANAVALRGERSIKAKLMIG
jgi:hypothetical protein